MLLDSRDASRVLAIWQRCLSLCALHGFYGVEFFDYGAKVVDAADLARVDWYEDAVVTLVPTGKAPAVAREAFDCMTVVIKDRTAFWTFYERNMRRRFETEEVQMAELEAIAYG